MTRKKISKSQKATIKDILVDVNPEPFSIKEWKKAAIALQEAIKKEKKRLRDEGIDEQEDNNPTRFPAY